MTTLARKLVGLHRTIGVRRLFARVALRAGRAVYARRTEIVIVKRLTPASAPRRADDGLDIAPITAAHTRALEAFNERHRTPKKVAAVAAYLHHGYSGFAAFLDGELIGYWWWVSATVDPAVTHPCVERFELRLGDDEVFAFDYFVTPAARERGVAVKFLSAIYAELAALGYRSVWGSVDADNARARWVYKVHGNMLVKQTVSHELGSWLLLHDRRLFVRNTRWSRPHPFEHRLLVSLKPRAVRRDASGAVSSHAA